jgi:asparagine synthase (glutamine-hydrolysing)
VCGITGAISLGEKNLQTQNLKAMCDIISHRGPDDAGYFVAQTGRKHKRKQTFFERFTDQKFQRITPMLPAIDSSHGRAALNSHEWDIFLGHRRLAIIDISSAGHQPMTDLSQSIWLAYNGEIYNFKELRQELEKKGYEFVTQSDTEVIIYAYHEWGIDCIKRFNGMFAFSLWDKKNNLFYLARDRYGIKPLYYKTLPSGELLFASEVKSILQYQDSGKTDVDCEALLEYFTFQNIFTDKTLYENVKLLPAGHYIEINLSEKHPQLDIRQYWDFHFEEPKIIKDEVEYIEELDRLFTQAVNRQLVSDVEVGSYLSGGMDSGSISAISAKNFPYLKTFTVGFDLNNVSGMELSFDERAKSELMSYKFKTEHYEMVLKSGDMERCMPDYAWHLEEPRVGQSYPNYYAAKLASKFVKVVLSGAGGDELFGGYPWRYYRAVKNNNFEDYIDKYYRFWKRLVDNKQLNEMFSPIKDKVENVWTRDIFRDVFKHHKNELKTPEDYVNHSLYFEAKTFLHGLLVVEDKLSMAHSLETRVPFLDNDLVDFAMKVPVNYKLGNLKEVIRIDENDVGDKSKKYFEKTNDGKLILRKALKKYMPEEITKAAKQGFSSPDQSWFKGESIEFVRRELLKDDSELAKFFDLEKMKLLVSEHLSGEQNRRLLVWSLLNFRCWLKDLGVDKCVVKSAVNTVD